MTPPPLWRRRLNWASLTLRVKAMAPLVVVALQPPWSAGFRTGRGIVAIVVAERLASDPPIDASRGLPPIAHYRRPTIAQILINVILRRREMSPRQRLDRRERRTVGEKTVWVIIEPVGQQVKYMRKLNSADPSDSA